MRRHRRVGNAEFVGFHLLITSVPLTPVGTVGQHTLRLVFSEHPLYR